MTGKRVELIAEIGQAHDGSVGILHSLVEAIAPTGVDAIKFQVHIAEAESSPQEPFRVQFSPIDATRQDYWRRMELTLEQWRDVKTLCETRGVEFLASPFSCAAVDLLEELGVRRYKIGSGEVRNCLMLAKIANTGKPILLSSGMSSYSEISDALQLVSSFGSPVTVMQCTTQYPTSPEAVGLNVIGELRTRFGVSVGFSDHSGQIFAGLAAVALGAEVVEVHVTFDKRMFGPDAASSLTITQLEQLVAGVRYIDAALGAPVDKARIQSFDALRKMFDKSIAVSRDMAAGERISPADLESKKPAGCGIPAKDYRAVIGCKLAVAKKCFDFLNEDDLE